MQRVLNSGPLVKPIRQPASENLGDRWEGLRQLGGFWWLCTHRRFQVALVMQDGRGKGEGKKGKERELRGMG